MLVDLSVSLKVLEYRFVRCLLPRIKVLDYQSCFKYSMMFWVKYGVKAKPFFLPWLRRQAVVTVAGVGSFHSRPCPLPNPEHFI